MDSSIGIPNPIQIGQAAPVDETMAISSIEEQHEASLITDEVKEVVGRFLDTQADGLTCDYVKSISFDDLILYLRKPALLANTRAVLDTISTLLQSLPVNNNGDHRQTGQEISSPQVFNIRVFLAAYMTALRPHHTFESLGEREVQLITSSTELLAKFEEFLNFVWTETTYNAVSDNILRDFPRLLRTYLNDFETWETPDKLVVKDRMATALRALYAARARHDIQNPAENGQTAIHTDLNTQIQRLRTRLEQLDGQTELNEIDAQLQAGLMLPGNTTPTPDQPYFTNMQLLQHASRITQGRGFCIPRTLKLSNEQIVHEILIDPSFKIDDNGSNGNDNARKLLVDSFWENLRNDLMRQPEPLYADAVGVIKEIQEIIIDASGDGSPLSVEAQTAINIADIKTMKFLDNWTACVDIFIKIADILFHALSQTREKEAKEKWEFIQAAMQEAILDSEARPIAMRDSLRYFSDIARLICIDTVTRRINGFAHIITENGVLYEQEKFQEKLNRGIMTLDNTTKWLSDEIDCIKVKQLNELVNGNTETLRMVHRSALINLITITSNDNPKPETTPEVLHLDLNRIGYFSGQYQKLVRCATIMRTISYFASASPGENRDLNPEIILESISNMVLAADPKTTEELDILFNDMMQTPLKNAMSSELVDAMHIELERALSDPHFDTRTTVSKRIVDYWKQYSEIQADTEPLHSVYAIAPLITDEARRLSALAALNIKIHRCVFDRIIARIAQGVAFPQASAGAVSNASATNAVSTAGVESTQAAVAGPTTAEPTPGLPNVTSAMAAMALENA